MLVYGMGCCINILDELLVNRMGVSFQDGVLVYGMGC